MLAAALAAAACDHPPVKEVAAAEEQVERARAAGAERYAPDRWKQAESALALARQRVEARDYRGALSSANDAAESARQAVTATGPAKAAARGSVEVAMGEIRSALDRANAERSAAVKAGVPRPALAALDARRQRVEQGLADARRRFDAEGFEPVQEAVEGLRTEVAPLPDLYRNARTQHAKRPAARGRSSPRRPPR